MSKYYYVNRKEQNNGDHEVHSQDCRYLLEISNRIYLGYHENCKTAVAEAKKHYNQVNGCIYCSPQCHTQ